jgi:hypothetical protein
MLCTLSHTRKRNWGVCVIESDSWHSQVSNIFIEKKQGRRQIHPRPRSYLSTYLQPEHDAQQSDDAQQTCAAFAVPVSPTAINANSSTIFNIFIILSS